MEVAPTLALHPFGGEGSAEWRGVGVAAGGEGIGTGGGRYRRRSTLLGAPPTLTLPPVRGRGTCRLTGVGFGGWW